MYIKPKRILNSGNHPQLIGMIHVLLNNSLQNTKYCDLFGIPTYTLYDLKILDNVRNRLYELHKEVVAENSINYLDECRSSVFVLRPQETKELENELCNLDFVKYFIERAINEAAILIRNGINVLLLENVGAPYFFDTSVPFEDLLVLNIASKKIREIYPEVVLGIHVLVSDIESIPIAMESGAYFIRSETSIFSGFRPEGKTKNNGNLAKFYYLRNWLNAKKGIEDIKERRYPQIWNDLQKKHTVFESEVRDLNLWVDNILFVKMEAVILTGVETGKDVVENDFAIARAGIEKVKTKTMEYFGESFEIPLVTGSGLNVETYKKYADFIIVGTTLKERGYWENNVSEDKVKELLAKLNL